MPTWDCCARPVPRAEVVYACQVAIVFIVVVAAVVNLSIRDTLHSELWVALLSSVIGIILPAPKIQKNVRDTSELESV